MRTPKFLRSRWVHLATAAIVALLGIASVPIAPDLWKDGSSSFATVGGFATFYGVIFAVIEALRAASASEMAAKAAGLASARIETLHNIRNATECLACIRFAVQDLDKEGWTSTTALARIMELYAAEFPRQVEDENSRHRLAVAALQSHAASLSGPLKGKGLSRLKSTLLAMMAEMAVSSSVKASKEARG